MRDLVKVLENLQNEIEKNNELTEEIRRALASIADSYVWAAPEMQYFWWNQAASLLSSVFTEDHIHTKSYQAIFCGQEKKAETSENDPSNSWCSIV